MPGEPQTLPVGNLRKAVEGFGFVELAYLFGSFVRGEVYHDLDLGLVLNESLPQKERWPYALKVAREAEKPSDTLFPSMSACLTKRRRNSVTRY